MLPFSQELQVLQLLANDRYYLQPHLGEGVYLLTRSKILLERSVFWRYFKLKSTYFAVEKGEKKRKKQELPSFFVAVIIVILP